MSTRLRRPYFEKDIEKPLPPEAVREPGEAEPLRLRRPVDFPAPQPKKPKRKRMTELEWACMVHEKEEAALRAQIMEQDVEIKILRRHLADLNARNSVGTMLDALYLGVAGRA